MPKGEFSSGSWYDVKQGDATKLEARFQTGGNVPEGEYPDVNNLKLLEAVKTKRFVWGETKPNSQIGVKERLSIAGGGETTMSTSELWTDQDNKIIEMNQKVEAILADTLDKSKDVERAAQEVKNLINITSAYATVERAK